MSTIKYLVVEGADGCGKTTQINFLANYFEAQGLRVHKTRLLGGSGDDFIQNEIRKLLLSPKFPTNDVEDEEDLFGLTDRRGIRFSCDALENGEVDIVLQDRGALSHTAYASAKGMSDKDIFKVHEKTLGLYDQVAQKYGLFHLVMLPEDERLAMERVQSRGEQVTPRLENLETQRKVIAAMNASVHESRASKYGERFGRSQGSILMPGEVGRIIVKRGDSREQVFDTIKQILAPYQIG